MNKPVLNSTFISSSSTETEVFAETFSKQLKRGNILLLNGDLGSGKTTFVRGLAKGLEIDPDVLVHSPTFGLVHEYPGKIPLFHFDLYRIKNGLEMEELAIEDYFDRGILVVEWGDKFEDFWPKPTLKINFETLSPDKRKIVIFQE